MKTAASCLKNTTMEEVFFSCSNELKKLKIKILTKNFLNNSINGKCELMNLGKFAFYKILLNYDDYISELGGYNIIKNKYKVPKRIDYYVFSECYVILYDFLDEVHHSEGLLQNYFFKCDYTNKENKNPTEFSNVFKYYRNCLKKIFFKALFKKWTDKSNNLVY